jgi:hypothetical protein
MLKTPKHRASLEIFASPPYRLGYDHDYVRPRFRTLFSAFVAAPHSNLSSSPFDINSPCYGGSAQIGFGSSQQLAVLRRARSASDLLYRLTALDVALPDLAAGLERHGAGEAGDRDPIASKGFPCWRRRSRSRSVGRPRVSSETHDLIRQMRLANPLWGAPRIHSERLKLGIESVQFYTVDPHLLAQVSETSRCGRTFNFILGPLGLGNLRGE